ncbi:hypothetical protein [Calidifontibacillus erzurumensis]|uniref:hypothetical protein n=1 Tax=Calidifontibacillus erzurumensis TaxID=2741433 RepID=UPI0035B55653
MNYKIEIRYNGKEIEGMLMSTTTFEVNKTNFNDMVLAVEMISNLLFEAECIVAEKDLPVTDITLKMYSDNDVLFNSVTEFMDYKKRHRIETRIRSNWSLITYVNNIPYHGEIVEGMLVSSRN